MFDRRGMAAAVALGTMALASVAWGQSTGRMAGKLYNDIDRDGSFDPGIDGTVDVGSDGIHMGTSCIFFPSGLFAFEFTETDVVTGDYELIVTFSFGDISADCTLGIEPASQLDPLLEPIHPDPPQVSLTVTPGTDRDDLDFGVAYRDVFLGDLVWNDLDGDGTADAGEPGLENVVVDVECIDDHGDVMTGSATTDSAGGYQVSLPCITPASMDCTVSIDASQPTLGSYAATTLTSLDFPDLVPGDTVDTADFGFEPLAEIGDLVWSDLDGDGTADPGEPGLADVAVTAECTLVGGGTLSDSTTSDSLGLYRFAVPDGDCTISVDTAQLPEHFPTTATSVDVLGLSSGEQRLDVDFGFEPPGTATVGDLVWCDDDGDGVVDAGEGGLGGIEVSLVCSFSGGGSSSDTATTDSAGFYVFYPSIPARQSASCDVSVDPAAAGGKKASTPTSYSIVDLQMGEDSLDNDFGFTPLPTTVSLSGTIFLDADFDGLQGAEEGGIGDAPVDLSCDVSDGSSLTESAVTDIDGAYAFELDLALGTSADCQVITDEHYFMALDPPLSPTTPSTLDLVGLLPGDSRPDLDFGYENTDATIRGRVFDDLNADGAFSGGEPGIRLIDLTLHCDLSDGSVVDKVRPSGPLGLYRFSVWMELDGSALCTVSVSPDAVPGKVLTTPQSYLVPIQATEHVTGKIFGFGPPEGQPLGGNDTRSQGFFGSAPAGYDVVRFAIQTGQVDGFGTVYALLDTLLGPDEGAPENFSSTDQATAFTRSYLPGNGLKRQTVTLILNLGLGAVEGFEPIMPSYRINVHTIEADPLVVPPSTPNSLALDHASTAVGDLLEGAMKMLETNSPTVTVRNVLLTASELEDVVELINESYDDTATGYVTVFDYDLPDTAGSCDGICGGQAASGCWCDEHCLRFGDCCPDKPTVCNDSCEGFCGEQAPGGCWCDEACEKYGDCCEDQPEVCTP